MPEPINNNGKPAADQRQGLLLGLRHPLASLLAALRFLTILPVSWQSERDGRFFQAGLIWFPLIGLLIGAATAGMVLLAAKVAPPSLLAFVAVVLLAASSGCLHLDGLADSGDGLLSARSRERSLEIMRDSRIGAMGVIVLIFVLLGKYCALATLSPTAMLQAVIFMPLAGRTAILVTMALLPYARLGHGLGRLFYSPDSRLVAVLGLLFCGATTLFFPWQSTLLVLTGLLLTSGAFSLWCLRKIGGATGDTLGATCELTELVTAIMLTLGTQPS